VEGAEPRNEDVHDEEIAVDRHGTGRADTGARATRPSPVASCGGDEAGSAQESVANRPELDAPFRLALLERGGALELGEGVAMVVAVVEPGLGHRLELSGAVGLIDVDEPGPLEELPTRQVRGDGDRPVAMSAAAKVRWEARRGVDGEECRASAGTEEAAGRSQHGELRSQSTQHIGVHHGVE
jgi:hypothetical protein